MKIVYLITGSGGSFYCSNCYRDMLFVRAIRKVRGIKAGAVPLYLPPEKSVTGNLVDRKVFFGAISIFLREKSGFLKNMPPFIDRFFNMPLFLKLAARQAGMTRTEGLEDMTLNMIEGDNTFRKDEVDRLVRHLTKEGKPDVIHLSNALILGIARQIKARIDVKIVCSLLNEDDWIDDMAEPYKSKAWEMIAKEAQYVDAFITPSNYYKELFISKTGIKIPEIHVVPLGFETEFIRTAGIKTGPPAIGFFNRLNYHNGFDKIVDAFIILRNEYNMDELELHVCGGFTGDDKPFISEQLKKLREAGSARYLKIFNDFQGDGKYSFFESVDVISVPVNKYDGYGLYILEANYSGVPVVQPATGAFPEIAEMTGGGITYTPDNAAALAENLFKLLKDKEKLIALGKTGKEMVKEKLSLSRMAEGLENVYNIVCKNVEAE